MCLIFPLSSNVNGIIACDSNCCHLISRSKLLDNDICLCLLGPKCDVAIFVCVANHIVQPVSFFRAKGTNGLRRNKAGVVSMLLSSRELTFALCTNESRSSVGWVVAG